MPTNQNLDLSALAAVLNITNVAALSTGFDDGKEQGFELSTGMSYDDEHSQWAYDVGTWIGACVAVRPKPVAVVLDENGTPSVVTRCDTVAEAEAFIAGVHRSSPQDAERVESGVYSIDAPEEMVNPKPDNRRVISARDLADEAKGIIRFG